MYACIYIYIYIYTAYVSFGFRAWRIPMAFENALHLWRQWLFFMQGRGLDFESVPSVYTGTLLVVRRCAE